MAPVSSIAEPVPTAAPQVRGAPPPLHGGPLALYRFMRDHGMLSLPYAKLLARWLWLKLRFRGRLKTDGLCFVCPGVTIEIGRGAMLHLGRWSWIGHGSKIRVHEGEARIGAKSVLGQECTISAFQHVSIGRECIIADRVMLIDFVSERPERMRIEGFATIAENDDLAWEYPGAQFIVRVHVLRVFPNCPRYIHRMALVERSSFVPRGEAPPPVPAWKQREWAADVLPAGDPARGPGGGAAGEP